MVCINSGWQSPDGVHSCSRDPHFKQGIVASEFPTGKRANAGRLPGPACSRGKEEPELVLVYLRQLHVNAVCTGGD